MNRTETAHQCFVFQQAQRPRKRIEIEAAPQVEFQVAVTDSRKRISGARGDLRGFLGLGRQARRDPAFASAESMLASPALRPSESAGGDALGRRNPKWCSVILFALLLNLTAFAELRPERWRWSNPQPHGNNVLDMLVTTDIAVQVGDGGTIYVQRSDERWAPAVTGVTNYLRGVAVLGARFIAVGENGCIVWSDNGDYFAPAQLSPTTTNWFEGVTASATRCIAVGDRGSIYITTNGINWNPTASGTAEWLRGVAFGNGAYVAVGENGTILRSTGGNSWSALTSGTTAHLNRVRYLGSGGTGQFIAVGNNGVALSSATGTAPWTSLNSGTTNHLYDVAMNDTGLLLVGDQEVRFRAVGGLTWTNQITALPTNAPPVWVYLAASGNSNSWRAAGRTGLLIEGSRTNVAMDYHWQPSADSSHAWLWDVTVQNGIYVAVGDLATIQTSLDGILWAREVVPVPHTNTVLLGVGGTTNLLLAVGNAGTVLVSYAGLTNVVITNYHGTNFVVTNTTFETLGLIWTNRPAFTTNTLQGVATGDNLFIVSGEAGKIFTSPDTTNWTPRITPTANLLSSVAIGSTAVVAVGAQGTLLRSGADGATWTAVPLGTTNWLYRVRWLENQFVVVGQNGAIYTSADATNWTARTSGTTRWLTDVAFVDGTWFVTGYQGTLATSTNLMNWTLRPLPTIKSLYSAATQNGRLVVAGIEGVILRQRIASDLSPVNVLGYNRSATASASGVTSVYELFLFGGQPDQFFEFQSTTNLATWQTNAALELFDPSGTIYLLRTRDVTNTPPSELYRTRLSP